MSAYWEEGNLQNHHEKRTNEKERCFEDVLKIDVRPMSLERYKKESLNVVTYSWCQYDCEHKDAVSHQYKEKRRYHVSKKLLVSITAIPASVTDNVAMVTCYHEHLSRSHDYVITLASIGTRKREYLTHLDNEERFEHIRNLKRIKGC